MADPAVDPALMGPPGPDLAWEPILDEDGLPEEDAPMTEDQAWPGLWLKASLALHAERAGLDWHVRFDSAVDYHDAAGRRQRVFPDLYMVEGVAVPSAPFNTWILGRVPNLAVELSSASSYRRDSREKLEIYRSLRVREYFVFDVDLKRIPGVLAGYRLDAEGEYQPIAREAPRAGLTRLHSQELGLDLEVVRAPQELEGYALRAFLPGSDQLVLTPQEAEHQEALRAKDEALLAKDEALRAKDEAIARLEAELRRRDAE